MSRMNTEDVVGEYSFMEVVKVYDENENISVKPTFLIKKNTELVIKDGSFFALWDPDEGCWVKDLYDVAEIIDKRVLEFVEKYCAGEDVTIELCKYYSSGVFRQFIEYCSSLSDNYYEVYCPMM